MSVHGGGCRCWQCHEGLRAHATDKAAYDRVLGKARLEVVTWPLSLAESAETACDGSYTCQCKVCSTERAALVDRAARKAA